MSASNVTAEVVQHNLRFVLEHLNLAYDRADVDQKPVEPPRLVAVSKTKPVDLICACYEAGQRHFGENYPQELTEKSENAIILEKCPEIKFHFIGTLQSNKASKLLNSAGGLLYMVETVQTEKMARQLNNICDKMDRQDKLSVMIQVNTSGEEQKSGIQPNEALDLADLIMDICPKLEFRGFMTIGALAHSLSTPDTGGPNPDFKLLQDTRSRFCARRGVDLTSVELSMGMSADYEEAIQMGSSNVRVGSTIFGPRQVKK